MAFNVAATVTLCSCRNASLFWIMLWLIDGPADHEMIRAGCSRFFSILALARWLTCYDARRFES
jgi:hypothetical protein